MMSGSDRPSPRSRIAAVAALGRLLAGLWRNRRGNVLIIAAFALIPLTFATGMAIDYSRAARLGTKLDAAADAAALSTVTKPMLNQSIQAACNSARKTFLNSLQQYNTGLTFNPATNLQVSVTDSYAAAADVTLACPAADVTVPGTFNAASSRATTVTYTGLSANSFGGVLGASTIPIGGTATAKGTPLTYLDYYILLDISQSMGIASTPADMQTLYNRSLAYGNEGCVFGCHVAKVKTTGVCCEPYANEYLAHSISPRVTLRIDSAISAIQTIINDAKAAAGTDQNIRIGVYTMSDNPVSGTRFTKVSAPTSSYDTLYNTVTSITLGNNVSGGSGDTTFDYGIGQFNNQIPVNGTGMTQASPKNYMFFVSDALRDTPGSGCTSGHCTAAFDSNLCNQLKLKGVMGTIYTTYLPIYVQNNSAKGLDTNYVNLAQPYVPNLAPAMQACATNSTYYYQASDGPAIDAAMKALFASTLKNARLSQ